MKKIIIMLCVYVPPGHTALHSAILAHGRMKRRADSTERTDSHTIISTLINAGADASAQVCRTDYIHTSPT